MENNLLEMATERTRTNGGRMTLQRRLVLTILEHSAAHPTAEEVYQLARQQDPTINRSTVYRTLRWLEETGFVSTLHFGTDRKADHFDPSTQLEGNHFHFRCRVCNKIIEFSDPQVQSFVTGFAGQHNATVENVELVLYGVCNQCKPTTPEAARKVSA